MRVHLASFSTPNFAKSHAVLDHSARKYGIKNIFHYTFENDVKNTPFYLEHRAIFDHKRGIGYWLWKPYLILESLKKMDMDDILVYADAGIEIIKPLNPIIALCEQQDIVFFQSHSSKISTFTRRDTFVLMDCDTSPYYDADMVQASFILIKKTAQSIAFVTEWLHYCANLQIVGDVENKCDKDNLPNFTDHRHDQSVLSILRVKYGIPLFRNPSQMGNPHRAEHPNDVYPQLINHHWGRPDGRFAGPFRRILIKFGLWRV